MDKKSESAERRKEYRREYCRRWRKENPEKHAEEQRKWREKNRAVARHIVRRSIKNATPETKKKHSAAKVNQNHARNLGWTESPRRCKRWQDWEILVIYDMDLTILQMVEKIGRSYRAIEKARTRYADRAPANWRPSNIKVPIDAAGTYRIPDMAQWAKTKGKLDE